MCASVPLKRLTTLIFSMLIHDLAKFEYSFCMHVFQVSSGLPGVFEKGTGWDDSACARRDIWCSSRQWKGVLHSPTQSIVHYIKPSVSHKHCNMDISLIAGILICTILIETYNLNDNIYRLMLFTLLPLSSFYHFSDCNFLIVQILQFFVWQWELGASCWYTFWIQI